MSIKPKTRRRLVALAASAAAVTVFAGGFVAVRKYQAFQHLTEVRSQGMRAYAAGDYPDAVRRLSTFLARNPEDLEALTCYAIAQQQVEEPSGRHLVQAISTWRRIVELTAGDRASRKTLLDLYIKAGYSAEALSLANDLLQTETNDSRVWRSKAVALVRLRSHAEAEDAARRASALQPMDTETHLLMLNVLFQSGKGNAAILAYAEQLSAKYPSDGRFDLVQSFAHNLTGNRSAAVHWARKAAGQENFPGDSLPLLMKQLDSLEEFSESTRLLERCARVAPDAEMQRQLAIRLYQTERWNDLLAQAGSASEDPTDPYLLLVRAMALAQLGRHGEVQAVVEQMERKLPETDSRRAWTRVLKAAHLTPAASSRDLLRTCKDAQASYPQDPFFNWYLGKAYLELGERDLALEQMNQAIRRAPAWGRPRVDAAQLLLTSGRLREAFDTASSAMQCAPGNRDAQVTYVLAIGSNYLKAPAQSMDSRAIADALARIDEIEARWPDEERLIGLRVGILAAQGNIDEARKYLAGVLRRDIPVSETTLLHLAMHSRDQNMGLDTQILELSETTHGMSAELAFSLALNALKEGDAAKGGAILESARTRAGLSVRETDLDWETAWATYLDVAGDARAPAVWRQLADQHTEHTSVQWSALAARCLRDDHEYAGRTLERLRALVGDQGVTWRLARARWLLAGNGGEKDAAEASLMLSEIVLQEPTLPAPKLLLAECMERLGNVNEAIQQLRLAAALRADACDISLELARLLALQDDTAEADLLAQHVARNAGATPAEKYKAALILSQTGHPDVALATLKQVYAKSGTVPADPFLAKLYLQQNRLVEADGIAAQLLKSPTPEVIRFAASLHAAQGRMTEAETVLQGLKQTKTSPAEKMVVQGDYFARVGNLKDAIQQYGEARTVDPRHAEAWRKYVAASLAKGDVRAGIAGLNEARQAAPQEELFAAAYAQRDLLEKSAADASQRVIATSAVQTLADHVACIEALKLLHSAQEGTLTKLQLLIQMERLAKQYPHVLAIQVSLAQQLLDAGRVDDAMALVSQALNTQTASGETARWNTGVFLPRRWSEMMPAARATSRDTSNSDSVTPLVLAAADLPVPLPDDALNLLSPYVAEAELAAERHAGILAFYVYALTYAERYRDAAATLNRMTQHSPTWRRIQTILAASAVRDPKVAAQWLEQAGEQLSGNSSYIERRAEQLQVARAWMALGRRFQNTTYMARGRQQVESLAAAPNAGVDEILTLAMYLDAANNLPGAEAAYRRLLKLAPESDAAMNNLADVLVRSKGDLGEALKLADAAIASNPRVANYYDTRAAILIQENRLQQAEAALKKAIELAPYEVEWRVNLITVLAKTGQTEQAVALLRQIRSVEGGRALSARQQEKLAASGIQ